MDILHLEYEKYKLDNGLEVILHQNRELPLAAVNIWYRVGSANEVEGKTGLAHLFEHMMFQGSENVPKEMHFRFIQEAGGTLNGSTSFDRTNYYEKVPSNFLELMLWLESDRMGFLIPALTEEKLKNQIDVVKNERLERYDNQPYGTAWEKLITNLYPKGHPYSWPTIGFMNDILNYSMDDVTSFFRKYYSPSNACITVAGDFEKDNAKDLIEKYFGSIPNTDTPLPVSANGVSLSENINLNYKENVQLDRIYIAWHSEKAFGKDDAALDILSDVLAGSKNSRLYKSLVYEKELAQDIMAYQYSGKYAGHFMIIATAKPGIKTDELKNGIFSELEKIQKEEITDKELLKSKNSIKAGFIYSMQNIDSLADQLNLYNFLLDEPNGFAQDLKRYESATASEIRNTAENYLKKPYVELIFTPNN